MAEVLEFVGRMWDGGAERLVVEYAKLLNKNNVSTKIVTVYKIKGTANSRRVTQNNISELAIFQKRTFWTRLLKSTIGRVIIPIRLLRIIKKENPKVLHVHLQLLQYICPIRHQLKGIKLFFTCHSEPSVAFPHSGLQMRCAKKLIHSNRLILVALHEKMRRELNDMFAVSSTVVLNNGVDFDEYINPEITNSDAKKRLGINTDDFVIGHIGRFSPVKNHEFIINVFNRCLVLKPNSKLLLVGSGELKDKINEKIADLKLTDRVIILSDRSDIPFLLRAMDVFIFPSLYEGLSMTLVEAQVSRLRCIISDRIDKSSILTDTTICLPLEKSEEEWCSALFDTNRHNSNHGNINDFNLSSQIHKVISLYRG